LPLIDIAACQVRRKWDELLLVINNVATTSGREINGD